MEWLRNTGIVRGPTRTLRGDKYLGPFASRLCLKSKLLSCKTYPRPGKNTTKDSNILPNHLFVAFLYNIKPRLKSPGERESESLYCTQREQRAKSFDLAVSHALFVLIFVTLSGPIRVATLSLMWTFREAPVLAQVTTGVPDNQHQPRKAYRCLRELLVILVVIGLGFGSGWLIARSFNHLGRPENDHMQELEREQNASSSDIMNTARTKRENECESKNKHLSEAVRNCICKHPDLFDPTKAYDNPPDADFNYVTWSCFSLSQDLRPASGNVTIEEEDGLHRSILVSLFLTWTGDDPDRWRLGWMEQYVASVSVVWCYL